MKNFLLSALLALIISGCSVHSEPDLPDHIAELENLTFIPPAEQVQELDLKQRERFGNSDDILMGRVVDVMVDDRNRVYMLDIGQKVVHVFNPDGSYHTGLGGEGRGPGEFAFPGSAEIRGHSLYVQDMMLRRVNIFNLNTMEFSESFSLAAQNTENFPELEGYSASQFRMINDSTLLVGFRQPGQLSELDQERYVKFYIMNSEGQIQPENSFELRDREFVTLNTGDQPEVALFSFNRQYLVEISDEGNIYTAANVEFLIQERNIRGKYQQAWYHRYPSSLLIRGELIGEYDNEMHQRMIRESDLPDTWPALNSLHVDDENRFWISVIGENGDSSEWWVLDRSGERLGTFSMPENSTFGDIRNGSIYLTERDENDLQTVVRYQVF